MFKQAPTTELATEPNPLPASSATRVKDARRENLDAKVDTQSHIVQHVKGAVFARLVPRNIEARRAFHGVAEGIQKGYHGAQHHRSFIDIASEKISLAQECQQSTAISRESDNEGEYAASSSSEPGVDTEATSPAAEEKVWTGSYIFNIKVLPQNPPVGWRLGAGRFKGGKDVVNPSAGVVVLLERPPRHYGIKTIHARLSFDKQSGILLVKAHHDNPHDIVLDGEAFGTRDFRALSLRMSILRLGKLEYDFVFTLAPNSLPEAIYQKGLEDHFRQYLETEPPLSATSATPSDNNTVHRKGWILKGALGRGSFGTVSAASNSRAQVVAFKTMARHDIDSDQHVQKEVQVAEQIRSILHADNEQRILRLVDVIYERENREYDGQNPGHVWLLYTPLCRDNFRGVFLINAKNNTVKTGDLVTLFAQVVEGLVFLHSHGFAHRDIKPDNLGVVSFVPPRAVILDLGCACRLPSGGAKKPFYGGTLGWLAPELWTDEYDEKVDVWSLGVVAYSIFGKKNPRWFGHSQNIWIYYSQWACMRWTETMLPLRGAPKHTIGDLINCMLRLKQEERISAAEALKHPALTYPDRATALNF